MNLTDESELLALIAKLKKQGEAAAHQSREQALINEAYVQGQQSGSVVQRGKSATTYHADDWFDEEELPRIFVNKLMSLRMTWVALMNKSRITAAAYPASDEPEDTYRAESSQKAIRFWDSEEDVANKTQRLVAYGCDHGTAALKCVYDPEDEVVRLSTLSIFDYLIDPTPEYADAKWVLFERWLDLEEAEDEWRGARLKGEPPASTREIDGVTDDQHVQCWELWLKPSKRFRAGLYVFVVGGKVVEREPFPYHKVDDSGRERYTLPIFVFKVRDRRNSSYGGTNMSDCVPLQRTVNELNARMLTVQRKTSGVHAWLPKGTPEDWNPAIDSTLYYEDGKGGDTPSFLANVAPNPLISEQRDYYESQLPTMMALNERTTGDQTSSVSGVALETTIQLDADKNSDASKSLEGVVLNVHKFALDLMGMFYTTARKMKIFNGTALDVASFNGEDTIGVDVRLEVGSELDQRSDVRTKNAETKLTEGAGTQLDLDRASNAPSVGLSKRIITQLIADWLAGKSVDLDVSPRPGVDFSVEVFAAELAKAKSRALGAGQRDDWVALHALAEAVDAAEPPAADAAPPAEAPPPEAPAAPPQGP